MVVLHQLDVGQLRQPDFHRPTPDLAELLGVVRIRAVGFVHQLVVFGVLPAREIGLVRAGYRDRGALVEPQCRIGLVDRAAMAVDGGVVFPLLEPAVEIRRQRHAGLNAAALEHLDQYRADRRSRRPEANDVDTEALALPVRPDALRVLLEALAGE